MKKIILLTVVLVSITTVSAQKYFTKTGTTNFKASKETFEAIEATNTSTTTVLNTENGELASLLFIKAFHFEVALMEEHFNENYMESDKFPKGTFKGRLEKFDVKTLTNTFKEFPLTGTLTIRGKDKKINTMAKLKKEKHTIVLQTQCIVKAKDFDIKIPSIVKEKIADDIIVNSNYELTEKK